MGLKWEGNTLDNLLRLTHKRLPPDISPPLQSIVNMLATLGGYLNRKNDSPPGVKVLWIGLQRARDFVSGFKVAKEMYGAKQDVCNDEL